MYNGTPVFRCRCQVALPQYSQKAFALPISLPSSHKKFPYSHPICDRRRGVRLIDTTGRCKQISAFSANIPKFTENRTLTVRAVHEHTGHLAGKNHVLRETIFSSDDCISPAGNHLLRHYFSLSDPGFLAAVANSRR